MSIIHLIQRTGDVGQSLKVQSGTSLVDDVGGHTTMRVRGTSFWEHLDRCALGASRVELLKQVSLQTAGRQDGRCYGVGADNGVSHASLGQWDDAQNTIIGSEPTQRH